MTMIYDLLNKQMEEIKSKMEELRPVYEEYVQLENLLKVMKAGAAGKINFLDPGLARGKANCRMVRDGRGGYRAKESQIAPRQDEAMAILKNLPGLTAAELGQKMGINSQSSRRLLRMLEERGLAKREYFAHPEGNRFKTSKFFPVKD